ncbi:hypothetical protein [Microcystis phage Mel-JY01]
MSYDIAKSISDVLSNSVVVCSGAQKLYTVSRLYNQFSSKLQTYVSKDDKKSLYKNIFSEKFSHTTIISYDLNLSDLINPEYPPEFDGTRLGEYFIGYKVIRLNEPGCKKITVQEFYDVLLLLSYAGYSHEDNKIEFYFKGIIKNGCIFPFECYDSFYSSSNYEVDETKYEEEDIKITKIHHIMDAINKQQLSNEMIVRNSIDFGIYSEFENPEFI